MSITIEGFSVVAKRALVQPFLDDDTITPPNLMHLGDDDIWRCSFMSHDDAAAFLDKLEVAGLNGSKGPNPDAILVNEFTQEVYPYCEWLKIANYQKAVIAWLIGSDPEKLVTHEGFDPAVGSGLIFRDRTNLEDLEFLRVEDDIEVFLDKRSGEEVYLGRTRTPETLFESACETIRPFFHIPGDEPLAGEDADTVNSAVADLERLVSDYPEFTQAMFFCGKGYVSLGQYPAAYRHFRRGYELEPDIEAYARELGGVCLELKKFDEAVDVAQRAATLKPDDKETLGNLAIVYLLAQKLDAAVKAVSAALRLDPEDPVNQNLNELISAVQSGQKPQPMSMDDVRALA
jgi:tetratricopeptide (TPR) repeat protein